MDPLHSEDETHRPPKDSNRRRAHEALDAFLSVGQHGQLFVELEQGSVQVRGHDDPSVRIRAHARGWASATTLFEVVQEGDEVHLDQFFEGPLERFWARPRVDVEVRVPRAFDVDVVSRGGAVDIAGVDGFVDAELRNGQLRVSLGEFAAGRLRCLGGSLDLSLPAEVHCDLDAHVRDGQIHTAGLEPAPSPEEDRLRRRLGTGGEGLVVRCTGGALTLRRG